ncbi:MAG: hypothetical protein WDN46_14295 [Methylocella sp.]
MTYLEIVQTACDELGLDRPAVVAGATDLQTRQLGALINRDLREIQQNYDWTALQTEYNLHVAQPVNAIGDVLQGSPLIKNIKIVGADGFSDGFSDGFGGGDATQFSQLWVVNGQFLPVATRVATVPGPTMVTIDQPATATQTGVPMVFAKDTYPEPADFSRFINQTWWDRTNRWSLMGPDSPQLDQWHRSGIVTIGPRRHFRQIGSNGLKQANGPINNYRLWPPPGAIDTPIDIVFEYISKNSVLSANGVAQARFLADTDFPILDENIFILGAKWRMWQIKGFDYAAFQQEYQDYVDRKYGNDGGAKTLSLPSPRVGYFASVVQDGSFPGPVGN